MLRGGRRVSCLSLAAQWHCRLWGAWRTCESWSDELCSGPVMGWGCQGCSVSSGLAAGEKSTGA